MALVRPLRIVIPGGSGLLGQILSRHFHERGHHVTVLSRQPRRFLWRTAVWDGLQLGDWAKLIDGADVVINLAGRNVRCRHSAAHQREIKHSRVMSTAVVGQAIAQASKPPAVWLNASTVGIYKHSLDQPMDDITGEIGGDPRNAPEEWHFLVDVAESWERSLFAADTPHTRRVATRLGIVMSPDERGGFGHMLAMVRIGLGGCAGSGRQYVSWIHDVDFVRAVEFLIDHDDISGPVNVCSPCPLPNSDFMRCLRQTWCTTYLGLPAPRWVLSLTSLVIGPESRLLLKSRRVLPTRLLNSGFDFHFPNWRAAAQDLFGRWRDCYDDEHTSAAAL
jgi:uncharacterized protein (TIGR01777 family)